MKRLLCLLLYLLFPCAAFAGDAWEFSKHVERSVVLTGTIEVNSDGSVHGYTIDKQDKVMPEVVQVIDKTVPTWKFQPIIADGKPAITKAAMSIRVVADKLAKDQYALSVRGASFSDDEPDTSPSYKDQVPLPRYPEETMEARVSGTVYVVALLTSQGTVEKVDAMQVDLRAIGPNPVMARFRKDLAQASVAAIKNWTFNIPKSGQRMSVDHWVVRIPVNFEIAYEGVPPKHEYGQWNAYVPGPIERIAWLHPGEQATNGSVDAIPNELAFQDDPRFVLLNPPGKG